MSDAPGPGQPALPPAPPTAAPPPPPSVTGPGPASWGQPAGPDGAQVPWSTPPSGNNGCLKACLVVGGILLAVAIVGIIALVILGSRIAEQVQRDPDSVFGAPCMLADPYAVGDAIGENVQVFELDGFVGGTMDAILDKRLLPDAPDCYAVGESGFVARIAVDDTGGAAAFADARASADGSFLAADVSDIGDEAFCTDRSASGSTGILVRWGETVAYVSVASRYGTDVGQECDVAKAVARTLEP